MSSDSNDAPPPTEAPPATDEFAEPEVKTASSPFGGKQTLMGHTGDVVDLAKLDADVRAGSAPNVSISQKKAKRRGKGKGKGKGGGKGGGKVTMPGGTSQRGKFWGKVGGEEADSAADEATVPIRLAESTVPFEPSDGGGAISGMSDAEADDTPAPHKRGQFDVADHVTEELNLDEIQDVTAPPPPKRKAPPRRPPPTRNRRSRPPPPKRESDEGSRRPSRPSPPPPLSAGSRPAPPLKSDRSEVKRPSKPALPLRDRRSSRPTPPVASGNVPSKPPRKPAEATPSPPAATAEPPKGPPRKPAPPAARASAPESMSSSPGRDASSSPGVAAPPAAVEKVPLPAPSLKIRTLAEVCKAELQLKPDATRAARLHFEIAQNATDQVSALKHHEAALEHRPGFLPALHAARALHLELGNVEQATKLFAAEIALCDDPTEQALLHFEAGCAHRDRHDDQDAARACFRQAAAADPTNATVLKALQHVELRTKDWAGLASALELEANAVQDDPRYRAAVVVRYARVLERRLRKPDDALEQYQVALALDPQTPGALAEIKRILFSQSRWQELVAAHESGASLTSDVGTRTQAFWSIGRIYSERIGALTESIAALEKAAELSPKDALIVDELARLYLDTGDHAGAASALERLASALERPAERLSALHRLGELNERRDGKDREAVRWYQAALDVDPSYGPALGALDALYHRTEDWASLARMYAAEGGSTADSERRAAAHARAGDILHTRLRRSDEAVEHYGHALALDPQHAGAFKALVALHTAAKRHRALIELYDRAVDIALHQDIAIAYMFKIGALYEDVLGEASGATATYVRILELQPESLSAIHAVQRTAEMSGRYRDLVAALDREAKLEKNRDRMLMLQLRSAEVTHQHLGDADGALKRLQGIINKDPKHSAAIMSVARIQQGLGQPAEWLRALELQLAIVAEGPARVALLIRMAELCETQLQDSDAAASWYTRAVVADPRHALARAALMRLLRANGDHAELAKVLAEEVASSTDPERTAHAAWLLGETYEVHLGKSVDAVVAYKAALQALPGYAPALDALARVHAASAQWKDLADTLAAQATAVPDMRLATDALLRSATLRAERLGKLDEAVATLDEVVSGDTDNLAALLALEALHVEQADDDRLEALLTVQSEVLKSTGVRVAAMVKQGSLLQQSSGDDAMSAMRAVCMGVLAAEPGNRWALGALADVANKLDDRELSSDVDARLAKALRAPSLKSHHLTRLGDALLGKNAAGALEAYRAALEHAPDNISAIRGLAIVGSALGDAPTMVDSYRREADFTQDDTVTADFLVQSAAVLARLGDLTGAVEDAEQALAASPDHEPAAQVLRALLGQQNLDRLIAQLTQAAHNARKVERKVALWRVVGELYSAGKQDVGTAISSIKRALVANEEDAEALLQLSRLYVSDSQHAEAAELLTKVVRLDDSQLDAHRQLARLYADHLEDSPKARKAIERVLADVPNDRDALRILLKLHLEAGDRDKARAVSEKLLEAAGDDDDTRAWALVEIARVELAASSPKRAAEALHDAVVITGIGSDAAKLYRRMAGDQVSWDAYVKTLRAHLDGGRTTAIEQLTAVYLEIARTQNKRLERPADAFRTLDEALDRVGDESDIVLERAELLAATGRPQEAATEFAALLGRSPYVSDAWRGLTQVLQQQGRQSEAAVAAAPLVVLGEASSVERNLACDRAVRPGAARPASFAESTLRLISAGDALDDERAAGLLGAVADGIAKAFPLPYDLYGVRKSDRLKARSGHPIRAEVDRLATVFGVEEVDVYCHAALGGDVALELTTPPSLMVPTYLAELPDSQRVFLLARPLAAIAAGTQAAYKLSADEVAMVLAGAVRRIVPSFEDGEHDQDALAVIQDKLSPSWFSRGKVDDIVQRYYAEPIAAQPWALTVVKTATRAAALLAGDLNACLAAMKYAGIVQADTAPQDWDRHSPLLDDILRFWVCDPAQEARRLAGLI